MKGRNCSNKQEETHLSGASIRSLVKQLTTSSKRDETNTKIGIKEQNQLPRQQHRQEQPPPPTPPQQQHHKKQVRRRLHTSRPYQERLLNMAEARREIVTALKFHRASMKQASNENPQSQSLHPPPPQLESPLEQVKLKSRRNPRIYAATTSNSNFQNDVVFSPSPNYPIPPYWTIPPIAPPPPLTDNLNLNLNLPNQTLGLNLNFHDFNNLIPPYVEMSVDEEEPRVPEFAAATGDGGGGGGDLYGLHQAMDDEGMAEIRSLGEQHEMEWNDKMNLVTSAWWFKFLKTMEIRPEENNGDDVGFHPLVDQVMEFPAWLNANDLDDYCSNDYSQDPALPCMDIGEIEGMYEEWLA